MSAATADLNINERQGQVLNVPVAAQTIIYLGTLVAINTATGLLVPASDAAGLVVLGRAEWHVDNSADQVGGALSCQVKRGVFGYANSGTNPVAYGNIGQACFVADDQTVAIGGTSHAVKAGLIVDYDPVLNIVWVDTTRADILGADVTLTQNSITDNSTGTAAAPVAGVRTIAAVTSTATAANAIADLAAELNLVKADLATLKALL